MSEPPTSSASIPATATRDFTQPPAVLYNAWLDPKLVRQWLFHVPAGVMQRADVDPRVGGEFVLAEQRGEMLVEHRGTFETLEPPAEIAFRFSADGGQTQARIVVHISPREQGSQMTVTHELAPDWAHFADHARGAWTKMLDNLATVLESS